MASPGDRKRKAESDDAADSAAWSSGPSPTSTKFQIRSPMLVSGTSRRSQPPPADVWPIKNRYFYENCLTLYEQHVEMLNQEFSTFFAQHGTEIEDPYWYVCEYLRRIQQLKHMYQSPFVGKILTCGLWDTCALGYSFSSTTPRAVKNLEFLKPVKISCGSTYTLVIDIDGKVYSFGGQDEGALGREGDEYIGSQDEDDLGTRARDIRDLRVRGFIPATSCPVENEDDCIIDVAGGYAKSLYRSLHNNVYTSGCFRDYLDKKLREKPINATETDKDGKKYPFGFNKAPIHLAEMPPGQVTEMACGCFASACIVGGKLVTWGVGTKGELGRPLPVDSIRNEETGEYYTDILQEYYLKPTIVPSLMSKVAISVACGGNHLVVVVRDVGSLESTVFSSGGNIDGQLGLGDFEDRKVLTPLEYTRNEGMMISKVRAGEFHTLALSLDGKRLYACGLCNDGQCGFSEEEPAENHISKLRLVQFPSDDVEIEEISCGESHNLAFGKPKGGTRKVYTWGRTVSEDECVLGHGEGKIEYRPRELVLTSRKDGTLVKGTFRAVDGGSSHSAFLFSQAPKEEAAVAPPARKVLRMMDS